MVAIFLGMSSFQEWIKGTRESVKSGIHGLETLKTYIDYAAQDISEWQKWFDNSLHIQDKMVAFFVIVICCVLLVPQPERPNQPNVRHSSHLQSWTAIFVYSVFTFLAVLDFFVVLVGGDGILTPLVVIQHSKSTVILIVIAHMCASLALPSEIYNVVRRVIFTLVLEFFFLEIFSLTVELTESHLNEWHKKSVVEMSKNLFLLLCCLLSMSQTRKLTVYTACQLLMLYEMYNIIHLLDSDFNFVYKLILFMPLVGMFDWQPLIGINPYIVPSVLQWSHKFARKFVDDKIRPMIDGTAPPTVTDEDKKNIEFLLMLFQIFLAVYSFLSMGGHKVIQSIAQWNIVRWFCVPPPIK